MPRKSVRDARRQQQQEAYRSISAEDYAFKAEETRSLKTPLPIYRQGPIPWLMCGTLSGYLKSLLIWADEARDYLINGNYSSTNSISPETASVLAAIRLSLPNYVVRSTKVRVFARHHETFFRPGSNDYRSDLDVIVVTRITNIGKTSMETEQELRLVSQTDKQQKGELIALISGTLVAVDYKTLAPLPINEGAKEIIIRLALVEGVLPQRIEFPEPHAFNYEEGKVSTRIRRSDCDAFNHLNNCNAVDMFTDLVPLSYLKDFAYFAIDYQDSVTVHSDVTVHWKKWIEDDDSGSWFWLGELQVVEKSCIRCFFISKFDDDDILVDNNPNIPKPLDFFEDESGRVEMNNDHQEFDPFNMHSKSTQTSFI